MRLSRTRTSFTSTPVLPQGPTAHWKGRFPAGVTSERHRRSRDGDVKRACLLSSQQHHPLLCINGHPGVNSGDVRLSADRRRCEGGKNRVQEDLKEGGTRSLVSIAQCIVASHPPGGSTSPAVTNASWSEQPVYYIVYTTSAFA